MVCPTGPLMLWSLIYLFIFKFLYVYFHALSKTHCKSYSFKDSFNLWHHLQHGRHHQLTALGWMGPSIPLTATPGVFCKRDCDQVTLAWLLPLTAFASAIPFTEMLFLPLPLATEHRGICEMER